MALVLWMASTLTWIVTSCVLRALCVKDTMHDEAELERLLSAATLPHGELWEPDCSENGTDEDGDGDGGRDDGDSSSRSGSGKATGGGGDGNDADRGISSGGGGGRSSAREVARSAARQTLLSRLYPLQR